MDIDYKKLALSDTYVVLATLLAKKKYTDPLLQAKYIPYILAEQLAEFILKNNGE